MISWTPPSRCDSSDHLLIVLYALISWVSKRNIRGPRVYFFWHSGSGISNSRLERWNNRTYNIKTDKEVGESCYLFTPAGQLNIFKFLWGWDNLEDCHRFIHSSFPLKSLVFSVLCNIQEICVCYWKAAFLIHLQEVEHKTGIRSTTIWSACRYTVFHYIKDITHSSFGPHLFEFFFLTQSRLAKISTSYLKVVSIRIRAWKCCFSSIKVLFCTFSRHRYSNILYNVLLTVLVGPDTVWHPQIILTASRFQ